ncbi:MAG: DUF2934 domain-containing protein [Nitrosomonadales bacterium]|nr:DUF2934 domain-containing protein [Nitrosomonadales bacterium]
MVVEQAKKTVKKAATAAKKIASVKTSGAVAGKTSKTPSATTVKKAAVKKSGTAAVKIAQAKQTAEKAPTVKVRKSPEIETVATATKPARKAKAPVAQPTPEERYRMVEVAAYYIAERSGFQGSAVAHWEAAEREIAARLSQ